MIYKIPNITLLQTADWCRTRAIFDYICKLIDDGKLDRRCSFNDSYVSKQYDLGGYGSVIENTVLTDGSPWRTWSGQLLENTLPWTKNLRSKLDQLNLNFNGFSYGRHFSSVKQHVDGKSQQDRKTSDQGHCNINFIVIGTDSQAFTYCVDQSGRKKCYASLPGQAWLLRTDVAHGIMNQSLREVFQIKFHTSFDRVKECFDNIPDLLDVGHC